MSNQHLSGEPSRLRLKARSIEVFAPHRTSYEVMALEGVIWATCEGGARDYILRAGDCVFFPAGRTVIVESLVPSALIEINPIGDQRSTVDRLREALRHARGRLVAALQRIALLRRSRETATVSR